MSELSENPKEIPVSFENSSPTEFTFPGPKTICKVSASTTFSTPSTFFSFSIFTPCLTFTLSLVIQTAFEMIFSFPPKIS